MEFVALSGAFLLRRDKVVSIKEVFYKRLPKIVIPLIFWSVVYVLFDHFNNDEATPFNLKQTLKTFYQGPVAFHLWFLYMLIGIYLLYPVINFFIAAATEIHIRYFLIIWFLVNCIIGITDKIFDVNLGIELYFFTGYIGYFILGHYLSRFTFTQSQLKSAYTLAIAGFIISSLIPYICVRLNFEGRSELIESDFTPDIVLVVTGLFLWMKNKYYTVEKPNLINKAVNEISKESFGIYLVHVLVMEIIFSDDRGYTETLNGIHPAWLIPVKAIITLIISYIIVKIITLIPVVRKVVG